MKNESIQSKRITQVDELTFEKVDVKDGALQNTEVNNSDFNNNSMNANKVACTKTAKQI